MNKTYNPGWTCTAKLEMNETDPAWKLEHKTAVKILKLWDNLKSYINTPPKSSAFLGYKGTYLKSKEAVWYSFGNTVVRMKDNIVESRQDKERRFEKTLLSTAPKGLIPETLFMFEFS